MYFMCVYIYIILGGAFCVMVTIIGNGQTTQVQIVDEAFCISYHDKDPGKSMNPTILLPLMGK